MTPAVLVINAGSSSVKFAVFAIAGGGVGDLLFRGLVEQVGSAGRFRVSDAAGTLRADREIAGDGGPDHTRMLGLALDWLEREADGLQVTVVGHRVVHGGERFAAPVTITPEILSVLQTLVPLAPLHQPHNLAGIRAVATVKPDLPQVACFDTAFHRTQPELAQLFALPRELTAQGVRRYGFHGLSYEYVSRALPRFLGEAAGARVVVAHLGNGASLCAMRECRSVASTMGFTALDGLMMGTRCGSIDPGVLLYLMHEKGYGYDQLTELLYRRSGLLGVSGIDSDMRTLLASDNAAARQAVALFVYRIGRELGSLAAALGGLDALVFTGGIGEHAAAVRAAVCEGAAWLGVVLDDAANRRHGPRISTHTSGASAWVIPTDEEAVIALHAVRTRG